MSSVLDPLNGLLLVDKPAGWTSFDAVAKVRALIRATNRQAMQGAEKGSAINLPKRVKVGHTGTLDPLATGLLVLLIGNYTKRAPELTKLDKTYEVVMKLGETSSTGDEEGVKTSGKPYRPSQTEVAVALQQFTGEIMQTPPAFSAMKVNGVRAYKLARRGEEVVIEPRPAKIHSIELTAYEYPHIRFTASVSSGTYIRSLVEDLGSELKTGAYMSGLRRTVIGRFNIADALPVTDLSYTSIAQNIANID